MTFQVDAIYDGGVLQPLVPPAIPDLTQVRLTIERAEASVDSAKLASQKPSLAELRRVIDALPQVNNNDGWSARQHDELLYDWKR